MNGKTALDAEKHGELLNPHAEPFDEAQYREEQKALWVETMQRFVPFLQKEGLGGASGPDRAPRPLETQNSTLLAALLDSVKALRQSKKLTRAEECLLILSDGKPHKTAEFQNPRTGSDGLRRIRELRKRGYRITRRKIEGSAQHEYQLEGN